MDDVDYAKYIIKKYIPFKNTWIKEHKFISRYNKSNDNKESRVIQLVNIIINLSKNNNTIIAEPVVNKVVEKVVEKPTKPKVDNKQIKQLKQEITELKKQLQKIQKGNIDRQTEWRETNDNLTLKNNNLLTRNEDLQNKVNDYEEKLKKYGWKPPQKDFDILALDYSISESDDEIQNELDKDLN